MPLEFARPCGKRGLAELSSKRAVSAPLAHNTTARAFWKCSRFCRHRSNARPWRARQHWSRHVIHVALRPHFAAPGRLGFRNHGVQRGRLCPRLAAETHAEAAVHASRAAAIRLRGDGHRRRKRMQPELAGAALEQHAGGLHRQRRHGIGLGARRIERARIGESRHSHVPFHLGVVGLEFLIADRPIGESPSRGSPPSTLRS